MEKLKKNFDGLDHGETGEDFHGQALENLLKRKFEMMRRNFDDDGKY